MDPVYVDISSFHTNNIEHPPPPLTLALPANQCIRSLIRSSDILVCLGGGLGLINSSTKEMKPYKQFLLSACIAWMFVGLRIYLTVGPKILLPPGGAGLLSSTNPTKSISFKAHQVEGLGFVVVRGLGFQRDV